MICNPKRGPKIEACRRFWLPFSRHFPKIDFFMYFGRFWVVFWFPFGSLLVASGSLLVPLDSLLATLAVNVLTFGAFWVFFQYFYLFSTKSDVKSHSLKVVTVNSLSCLNK